jgi:hypothetical protein
MNMELEIASGQTWRGKVSTDIVLKVEDVKYATDTVRAKVVGTENVIDYVLSTFTEYYERINTHTWGSTIHTIRVTTIYGDPAHLAVTVERRWHNKQGDWEYIARTYRVPQWSRAVYTLGDWAGTQVFGAPKGRIDIRQNAHISGYNSSVFYTINRLKRTDKRYHFPQS